MREFARTHCPAFIRADAHWLRLVLQNLIRNALEAAPSEQAPEIALRASVDHERLVLTVTDNGPGIAPQNRERLFEPFFSTKGEAGTGLGLNLCRKIIDLHAGRLELDATSTLGATFRIQLPLARTAETPQAAAAD